MNFPVCAQDGGSARLPCAGKSCGDPCSICDPATGGCTVYEMYCDQTGQCGLNYPLCTEDAGPPLQPCAGKSCGDACTTCTGQICPDVMEYCDANGQCTMSLPVCSSDGGSGYEPCAGKVCGDTCTLCPPNDSTCIETTVVKTCNAWGQCGAGPVTCPDGVTCKSVGDCPITEICMQCADGSCAEMACILDATGVGKCGWVCK
jgi:hypothetical protein